MRSQGARSRAAARAGPGPGARGRCAAGFRSEDWSQAPAEAFSFHLHCSPVSDSPRIGGAFSIQGVSAFASFRSPASGMLIDGNARSGSVAGGGEAGEQSRYAGLGDGGEDH